MKKLLVFLSFLALSLPFGLTNKNASQTFAFDSDDWSSGRGSKISWTFNDNEMISTSSNWMGDFLLYNDANTKLDEDNRCDYTLTTTFKGSDYPRAGIDLYRGVVLFYLDDGNYIVAVAKWSYNDRQNEMQELMVYGEIDGHWYMQSAADTHPQEWRDLWVDGNGIPVTSECTLSATITPADENTDIVTISVKSAAGSVSKSQQIYNLSKQVNSSIYQAPKVGIVSYLGKPDSTYTESRTTFTNFECINRTEIGKVPYINEAGTRNIHGYVGEKFSLAGYTATNDRGDILTVTRQILAPDGESVELDEKGRFTPEYAGEYKAKITCYDSRHDTYAEPIEYSIYIYPDHELYLKEEGSKPSVGLVGQEVVLPSYSFNVKAKAKVKVISPNGYEFLLTDNKFTPEEIGLYSVHVSIDDTFFEFEEETYDIYVFEYNPIRNPKNNNTALIVVCTVLALILIAGSVVLVIFLNKRGLIK